MFITTAVGAISGSPCPPAQRRLPIDPDAENSDPSPGTLGRQTLCARLTTANLSNPPDISPLIPYSQPVRRVPNRIVLGCAKARKLTGAIAPNPSLSGLLAEPRAWTR